MLYSLEQIKKVYWETFHKSGEKWFNYLCSEEESQESTECQWNEFLENLKKYEPAVTITYSPQGFGMGVSLEGDGTSQWWKDLNKNEHMD